MSDKEKITVKLKHGDWEVEISCPEDKVKQTVENVISGIDTKTYFEVVKENKTRETQLRKLNAWAIWLEENDEILE